MQAEAMLSDVRELSPAVPRSEARPGRPCPPDGGREHLAFAGRVLAFTYDDRGRCDGFVLELGPNSDHCFECRGPAVQAILRRAFVKHRRMTILTAAAQPRRPLAILPDP